VFGSEGLVVAFGGWVLGLPAGYLVEMLLTWTISSSSGMDIAYIYPLPFVLASLFATLLVTVLIIQPPLWKAGHFRPGDALRYQ
jgi:ABC-type lipoprotein release transport system permease subunit